MVRTATLDDAEAIYSLGKQIPELKVTDDEFMSLDEVRSAIADPGGIFIVSPGVTADSLRGFLYARIEDVDRPPGSACIVYIATAPNRRREGVARALWNDALTTLRDRGVRHVYAWAHMTSGVISFLAMHGFRRGREYVWMDRNIEAAPSRKENDADFVRGFVVGIADMLRMCHNYPSAEHALRTANITRSVARQAGVMDSDLNVVWPSFSQNS